MTQRAINRIRRSVHLNEQIKRAESEKMEKPKWQKALVVKSANSAILGLEVWIDAHRFISACYCGYLRYHWNVTDKDPLVVGIHRESVELLSRSNADFADDVSLITYEQFLALARVSNGRCD